MTGHTSGPLTITPIPGAKASCYIREPKGSAIGAAFAGFVHSDGTTSFPAEANARLWTAAPDLLAACKELVQGIVDYQADGDSCPICDILPSYGHCTGEPDCYLPDMAPWPRCAVLIAQDAIKLAEEGK